MKPFDIVRASFYLVAAVFAVYAITILATLGMCAWNLEAMVAAGRDCFKERGMVDALSTLLASALAFAAGRMSPRE